MAKSRTEDEVRAIVEDYFDMLAAELRGEPYEKTAHRRALSPRLNDRSDGSIEFKHQNLSAVLIEAGLPYITGYKPRHNYQGMLRDVTEAYLSDSSDFYELVQRDVERPAEAREVVDILNALVAPPRDKAKSLPPRKPVPFTPRRVDYLAREARNQSLGRAGEEFVIDYEKARLEAADKGGLADRVEHISETKGDGAGFDVLSFEPNGTDRYIEVKTTRYGDRTPFHVTPNEIRFSESEERRFFLYRVFQFRTDPKLYHLQGAIPYGFELTPSEYRARLKSGE